MNLLVADDVRRRIGMAREDPPSHVGGYTKVTCMNVRFSLAILLTVLSALSGSMAQTGDRETAAQREARLQWWREARFGLFIHWGPVSLKGTEIGWSRAGERRGYGSTGTQVPAEVYDQLYTQFNPTNFNAREWVAIAQAAGIAPENCVMIGDSTIDIQTAANAEMKAVAVTWGYHDRAKLTAAGAEVFIDHPSELAGLLENPG